MFSKLMILSSAALMASVAQADIYVHGLLRGSNNRNCRNDNNDERRNANRLFDSQNNDDGGYSCPRRYPFSADNNGQSGTVDPYGKLTGTNTLDTETYWVYGGSEVEMTYTMQHGCGSNPNMNCELVWQYMVDGEADFGGSTILANDYLRDGTPINNNDDDNTNDEATTRIGGNGNGNNKFEDLDKGDVNDGQFGYMEHIRNFELCAKTERNKGLFTADQNLNNKENARYTRQDNNGQRYGFECNEERDYYPYWRPSPWHDLAILTSNVERCETKQALHSQNVVSKCNCINDQATEDDPNPIEQDKCVTSGGVWQCEKPWKDFETCGWGGGSWSCDAEAPKCIQAAYSRDNHLGNQNAEANEQADEANDDGSQNDATTQAGTFKFNMPEFKRLTKMVLRLRYNASTLDFDMDTTDSSFNGDNSPIIDRDEREEESYMDIGLAPAGATAEHYKLSLAVNTDQHARTFQDRTYVFMVKPLPEENGDCRGKIKNLGMRGKRGNIVQTYPSVEYDFSPQYLPMTEDDCLHIHWTGSDYNPNRNPNNGEGGPSNPNNINEAKADRTNLVQVDSSGRNMPMHWKDLEEQDKCFFRNDDGTCDAAAFRRFALLDQDMSKCLTVAELKDAGVNNRQARERDPRNCGKINGGNVETSTPHFDGGLKRIRAGEYQFMSTRNNNFSNRSQKLRIKVLPGGGGDLSSAEIAGITVGVLVGVAALAFAGVTYQKKRIGRGGGRATTAKMAQTTSNQARPMV